MAHCRDKFPALTMLSLMRNPASPPFMALSETDSVKQKRFRCVTLKHACGSAELGADVDCAVAHNECSDAKLL